MNVRFSQPVFVAGKEWGQVANLIVDPMTKRLTHIVVESAARHSEARRVRLNQFRVDENRNVLLNLAEDELRRLPHVRDSVHQRPSRPVLPGRDWDVGIRKGSNDVRYPGREVPRWEFDDERTVEIVFDRIPPGTVELRAESRFILADGSEAGFVYGLSVSDSGTITRLFVLRPPRVARQLSEIAASAVVRYEMDRVVSSIQQSEFGKLERFARQRVSRRHPSQKTRR